MNWDRREFLQFAGVGAALCVGGGWPGDAEGAEDFVAGGGIGYRRFKACEGGEFLVAIQTPDPVTLRLQRVEAAPTLAGYPGPEMTQEGCFTLVFESGEPIDLVEAVHAIRAPDGGTFAALISPLSTDGRRYQVVFNRI